MALTRSTLDINHAFVNATSAWTTPSFTPADGSLLVVLVSVMNQGAGDVAPDVTITDSAGLTWVPRAQAGDPNAWSIGAVAWTAQVTTGVSMTTTFDAAGWTIFYGNSAVIQYTGHDTTTPVGATGFGSLALDGATSITLDATPAATSEIIGIATLDPDTSTSAIGGSGYVEIDNYWPGGQSVHVQARPAGSTSTSFEWQNVAVGGSANYKGVAVAVEVREASVAAATPVFRRTPIALAALGLR